MIKQYEERDPEGLDEAGGYFYRHMLAMTAEGLHSKADIACELGYRDYVIDQLKAEIEDILLNARAEAALRDCDYD